MKPFLYFGLFSVIFVVFMVSGWLYLFNEFPFSHNSVFWLIHGACLGLGGYLSWLYNRNKSKQSYVA